MSGQWEVVGKNKNKQNGKSKKMSKNEKKKFVDNAPKVEDLLPLAQVKTLYAALDTNKEPPKPVEKVVKTKENEPKKAQKKPKEKKETMVKENKPLKQLPKTIEAAVALITAADVENVLEVGRLRFPEAPLVSLKSLASWLNTKLPVDHVDNVFTAKSWEYPLCLLTADTRAVLKKALKEVPEPAVQMFYKYCLTAMADDMAKGSPVTGYKMLVQLMASQFPSVAVHDIYNAVSLREAYQHRPAIGCSVMWAVGQAGFKDLSAGLQLWQEVMLQVYELRNYTHFVCDYLKQLLARHSTSKALTVAQYLAVLDAVFSCRQPPNNELKNLLGTLQGILFNIQDKRLHNAFESVLSRLNLSTVNDVMNPPALKEELAKFLTECLVMDTQSYAVWRQVYTKHLVHSAVLLYHLNLDWSSVSARLPLKMFKDTLKTFKVTNDDMSKRKLKAEGLQECSWLCEALLKKMSEGGKKFPWKSLSLVLLLAAAGVVAYDARTHNGFKESKTGVLLRDVGALKYGEQALLRIQDVSRHAYRWGEQNVPVYWVKVKEVSAPYLAILLDYATVLALHVLAGCRLIVDYCLEKKPVIEQWVSDYAPGVVEAVSQGAVQLWSYGLQAGSLVLKYLLESAGWLRNNVFVGRLSPENLQRVTLEALNTTQVLASQTLSWLSSQVQPSAQAAKSV